jgi:hypothetical protein
LRNWSVSWNATFCAPVGASPESWSKAVVRLLPVKLKSRTKAGGSCASLVEELVDGMADDGEGRQRGPDDCGGKGNSVGRLIGKVGPSRL